jgi:hypothetical protein
VRTKSFFLVLSKNNMPRKKKIVGGALNNAEKPGPAGETQGVIPVTRAEEKNNSAPILNAMPHPPPEYKPTEPLHHNIFPTLPSTATLATSNDHTLPHSTTPSQVKVKLNHMYRNYNPLVFTGSQPYGTPAHRLVTTEDNRHIVLKGGGLSFDNIKKVGEARSWTHPFSGGELGPGDNASGVLEGGSVSSIFSRVGADVMTSGLNEANIAVDKQQKKMNAKQKVSGTVPANPPKKGGSIREKHSELIGGGYRALGSGRVGGKSIWGDIAGTALNVSKFAAENPELVALALAPVGV